MLGSFLAIIGLIAVSAFFSGTEIAYASANEVRLRRAAEAGQQRERWTYWIYQHYDEALTAILIGNNLANIASSSISTMIVITLLGNGYAWVATVVMTVLLLIFGEIVPKVISKEMPERISTLVAPVLRGLMWITQPLVRLVQGFIRVISRLWGKQVVSGPAVTEDDLEIMFDTAEDEGSIDENTSDLLQSALDFDDVLAYEIITPRVDMVAIDIEDSRTEIIDTALSATFSRIPVYEENKDNIIGVLHVGRFLKLLAADPDAAFDLRELLMPVCFVPKTTPLPAVLGVMRQRKCHLVIVSDEFGGTLGILTMEDVLEELVGDIWDESDEIAPELTLLPDGRYEVSGDMRMDDFLDALDKDDRHFSGESITLGGWAIECLGGYPKVGDAFDYDGLTITVEAVHKRRVTRVSVAVHSTVP